MAQTSYEEYLSKLMGDAYNQPTKGGLMSPVAMPDVSNITSALQNVTTANKGYAMQEMSDLSKVRSDFLAKKAEDAQKQVEELLAATPQSSGGGMMSGGETMSDAAFVSQMAYGIQNVQTMASLGLISPETAQALINDAIAKAKAVDPQVLQTQNPAPVRSSSMSYYSGFSDGGDGYSGGFGSPSGAEGASIGAGGE